MTLRRVALTPEVPGSLWLSSMPGRRGSWSAFEAQARQAELGLVVCLTPRSEVQELSPTYHAALLRGGLPFVWMNLPMRDFGLPEDSDSFRREIERIALALRNGESVMLHCAAGIGRTGSAAACVLKALGRSTEEAVKHVRDAGSNPQSAQQSGLVDLF